MEGGFEAQRGCPTQHILAVVLLELLVIGVLLVDFFIIVLVDRRLSIVNCVHHDHLFTKGGCSFQSYVLLETLEEFKLVVA